MAHTVIYLVYQRLERRVFYCFEVHLEPLPLLKPRGAQIYAVGLEG